MSSHVITPGPYRATKLWNEVTRLFRAGMPLKKHRQNFRHHSSCFTANAAVDWLHQLLRNNSNFGPDVTRQQTVQLLKKFLKNHVIEDVKGRWGTEEFEDNNGLYRFPSTSPLKPIPCPSQVPGSIPGSVKKKHSFRDKDGFFKFRTIRKQEKDAQTQENVDPALYTDEEGAEHTSQRRELTVEDEHTIWKDITLTHLQRILGVASLGEVLDYHFVNPQNIIHNMTKVNKHGVVTLDDKTNDLPHWVLSAMKSLANWPKYDSAQPSYPGFERDVFKTVSDYFYSLPQPLLTYELYELFINVLVFCGYVAPSTQQLGKRKKPDLPSLPPPAKASFRSTECLLLSLLRQGGCDEAESPMREVLGIQLQNRGLSDALSGGSCMNLSTMNFSRPQTRSYSLETILDDSLSQKKLFQTSDSLELSASNTRSESSSLTTPSSYSDFTYNSTPSTSGCALEVCSRKRLSLSSMKGLRSSQRMRPLRPCSVGSCLDIVVETREEEAKESRFSTRAASCLDVRAPAALPPPSLPPCPAFTPPALAKAHGPSAATGPRPAASTSNLQTPRLPTVTRRCISSLDVSKPPPPMSLFKRPLPQPKPENSLLQPQCERMAIEALQLCTLLLPPTSRRKLQLLMRMMSRISQNVDMPRLHPAIGTRTLMVHTFSGCVLGSAEECDLDELLATRLVSFFMDHQQSILSVPEYLLTAIGDHIRYLRTVQVPIGPVGDVGGEEEVSVPLPIYAFCRQISGAEFEQQKIESLQQAMEELLETLLTDQNMSEKDRRKKLKQFQKQYPDIYSRRVPATDQKNKPKIKPPLLSIKKTKVFSIRN
ncbi:DEP domain-containing protein 1A isoform X1 [Periophthalmus magnuspinnatus]|uniref:DEP domain-containing protein 1A isoform X1 n=1 Tax=Periophthalmus magnuspinnatus TaxID=409849 RepID=UPI0024369AC5|nr:DEP domain-containing protein 1A isoform X1 [Periophthalmus magnuspinnatus]